MEDVEVEQPHPRVHIVQHDGRRFQSLGAPLPPATDAEEEADLQSRLEEFVWRVIGEVCPLSLDVQPQENDSCRLELIGTRITSTGKQEGMKSTIQESCTQCRLNGRKERNSGRAIRTSFRCAVHRNVHLCNASKGPCLQEHMEEHGCL